MVIILLIMVINRFYLPLVNILLIMVYTNGDYMVIIWLLYG